MAVRLACRAAVLIAGLVLCLPATSDAADSSKLESKLRRVRPSFKKNAGAATPSKLLATARSR